MDHAPIFELDFICPSCNTHASVYERATEIVEDEIDSMELLSWEGDNLEVITVFDVDAQTNRINSYGTDAIVEWFCTNCNWSLPVDNREELFMWLHRNEMLIPT